MGAVSRNGGSAGERDRMDGGRGSKRVTVGWGDFVAWELEWGVVGNEPLK